VTNSVSSDTDRNNAGNMAEYLPEIPDALPILPLIDTVVVPMAVVPIVVGQERSVKLVDEVMHANRLVALVTQRTPDKRSAQPEDL
jgi:ATP-dependent Lon protease